MNRFANNSLDNDKSPSDRSGSHSKIKGKSSTHFNSFLDNELKQSFIIPSLNKTKYFGTPKRDILTYNTKYKFDLKDSDYIKSGMV